MKDSLLKEYKLVKKIFKNDFKVEYETRTLCSGGSYDIIRIINNNINVIVSFPFEYELYIDKMLTETAFDTINYFYKVEIFGFYYDDVKNKLIIKKNNLKLALINLIYKLQTININYKKTLIEIEEYKKEEYKNIISNIDLLIRNSKLKIIL